MEMVERFEALRNDHPEEMRAISSIAKNIERRENHRTVTERLLHLCTELNEKQSEVMFKILSGIVKGG